LYGWEGGFPIQQLDPFHLDLPAGRLAAQMMESHAGQHDLLIELRFGIQERSPQNALLLPGFNHSRLLQHVLAETRLLL
jgi:hypothetical protein